jgi:uncharacterized protein (DUF2336 family)
MVNRSLSTVWQHRPMIVHEFLRWIETAPAGLRAEAANALARAYLYSEVDEDTRSGMEAAMTVLLDDPSSEVRFALADALGSSPDAPRHILLTLAGDQMDIAAIVLARSPIFIDAELVDIVAAAAERLQIAVAERPLVSSAVSAAIAEVGEMSACRALLENVGAEIARISLKRIAERFDDVEMRDILLARDGLPAEVRQMLIRRLGDTLGALVVGKSWVGEDRAATLTREACDRATVSIAAETESEELVPLIEHLRVTEQLTTALLLRALCAGNVRFFETALSILSAVPEERVASLVRSGRANGLRAVYSKAGLPPMAFDAFMAALETCRAMAEEGTTTDRYRFTCKMVENVLSRYRDITDGEVNELMTMLRRFAADQAREAARDYARLATAA